MNLDELLDRSTLPPSTTDVDAGWARVLSRHRRLQRRRAAVLTTSIALVAAGGAWWATSSDPSRQDSLEVGVEITEATREAWRALPAGPLSARDLGVAVWTGSEMIIAGGSSAPPCPAGADCTVAHQPLADGAALDPATGLWRRIANAPTAFATGEATWTGEEMLVATVPPGDGDPLSLQAYDPVADAWSQRTSAPVGGLARPAWTGEVWAFPSYRSAQDWIYRPSDDTWEALPPDPIGPATDRTFVWTGHELVLAASVFDQPAQPPNGLYRLAAFAPGTGSWRRLPDPEMVNNGNRWVVVDNLLVNLTQGSSTTPSGQTYPHGGILDLATETWRALPEQSPLEVSGSLGRTGFRGAAGGWAVDDLWLFDPAAGRWNEISPRPDGARSAVAVWTGSEILSWAGVIEDTDYRSPPQLTDLGFGYTPPAPPADD